MGGLNKLLVAMLIMVFGAYLIDPVNTATLAITTPTYDSSVASLGSLLPLLMMMVIIFTVFKGFGEI